MPSKERRASPRFAIEFPVLFRWGRVAHYQMGFSADASRRGIFVSATQCPPRDSEIDLLVFLPLGDSGADQSRLHFSGRVIRVQSPRPRKGRGFAVFGSFSG
jgi:hypothetical protein